MAKRKRRAFTREFKAQAVRIVPESAKAVGTVSRELDLTETALRSWVRQAEIDAGRGAPGALTTEEREELGRLRRENRTLRMERDILKRRRPSSRRSDPVASEFPIPPPELRLGYGRSIEEYLANGQTHVQIMQDLLGASGARLKRGTRILDFGCGAGRMIRWLAEFSGQCEVWGTDINAEHIVWCSQNLDPPFHFLVNTIVPHLPFEDRYFGLVYVGSVFTHIDDLAATWLLELRRILRAAGKLYVTIHNRHSIYLLAHEWPEVPFAEFLRTSKDYEEFAQTDFSMFAIGRGTESQVFYDLGSFCEKLRGLFNVLSVTEGAYGYQTAVLMEKL